MADPTPTPALQVPVGANVRVRYSGVVETTGVGGVGVRVDDGTLVTVAPASTLLVLDVPLPGTVGSVILATANGGPAEPLVLALNNNQNPRWFQPSSRAFLGPADVIVAQRVLYQAPAIPTRATPAADSAGH